MIISKDVEKAFDNFQNPFMIKIFKKLGIEENFLKPINGIYEKLLMMKDCMLSL